MNSTLKCPKCGGEKIWQDGNNCRCHNCEYADAADAFRTKDRADGDKQNTNCLEGVRCPKCGSREPFVIDIETQAQVWDAGVEDIVGDNEWNNDSGIRCIECGHTGTVGEFQGGDPEVKDFTVVGAYPDAASEYSCLRDGTFVEFCEAKTPGEAARKAQEWGVQSLHGEDTGHADIDEIAIIAVFSGKHPDVHNTE